MNVQGVEKKSCSFKGVDVFATQVESQLSFLQHPVKAINLYPILRNSFFFALHRRRHKCFAILYPVELGQTLFKKRG